MARLAIRMPKMSMTMTEGDVSTWLSKVGDEVAVGDVVCEVMTDKVDMEVESTVAGTLVEIVHETGTVAVGEPIAWIEGEDDGGGFGDLLSEPSKDDVPAEETPADETPAQEQPADETPADEEPAEQEPADETPAQEEPADETGAEETPAEEAPAHELPEPEEGVEPDASPSTDDRTGPPAAVPRARGLAREHGVDLATVSGTGPDGQIQVSDVEGAVRPAVQPDQQPDQEPEPDQKSAQKPAAAATVTPDRRVAVRQAVARKMTASAAIPQFTLWRTFSLERADAARNRLSWTTVLLRAYAAALREVPELLSRWEDDRPTEPGAPAVALAIATDRGLLVPTFVDPDLGAAQDRDAEIRAVVAAARGGKIDKAYMSFANSSLSNLGGLGVDRFQALLTPPQASVLSLGTIGHRPVAVPGGVGSQLSVEAGLTVDHRVADGAHGAQLLAAMARRLDETTPS